MGRRKWFLGCLAIVALVLFGMWYVPQRRLVSDQQRELSKLREAGEPLHHRDLLPPVPPALDGTPFYRQMMEQLEQVQGKLPQEAWRELSQLVADPTKPVNLQLVRTVVKETQPALNALREAVAFPHMRLVQWEPVTLFPHFTWFRRAGQLLVAEALLELRRGNTSKAADNCQLLFRLARLVGDEPCESFGPVTQGLIFVFGARLLRHILANADISPATCRALLKEVQAWDIDRDVVRGLQMERVNYGIQLFERLRTKPKGEWLEAFGIPKEKQPLNWALWVRTESSLLAENQLLLLRYYNQLIAFARKGPPYDWAKIEQLEQRTFHQLMGYPTGLLGWALRFRPRELAGIVLIDLHGLGDPEMGPKGVFQRIATAHAYHRLTQAVLGLRLYYHDHRRYPDSLQALTPRYLPQPLLDPFDGKPLRYRKLAKGCIVWSVSKDLRDDGGKEENDIAWHLP